MKKFLARLLIFLLILFVVGFFLSGDWRVTRSRTLHADRALVHSYVADLHSWPQWTAWTEERDPECVWTFAGPPAGKGASYSWDGPKLGKGHLEITASSLAKGIEFELSFGEGGEADHGSILYADVDGGLDVTWDFWGREEGSIGHWMALVVDRFAGPDFEKSLEGLAKVSERGVPARLESGVKEVLDGLGDL
jgi:hypothetical protein